MLAEVGREIDDSLRRLKTDPTVAAVGTLLFLATSLIIIAGLLLGMRRGRT